MSRASPGDRADSILSRPVKRNKNVMLLKSKDSYEQPLKARVHIKVDHLGKNFFLILNKA